MKIVIDMNLSPLWASLLRENGYDAKHWSEIGAGDAPDSEIMKWAGQNGYIVFTHDLDFGTLLYATNATTPSVIQLRTEDIRPSAMGNQVLFALRKAEQELHDGALVTVDPRKNRLRLLPLKKTI